MKKVLALVLAITMVFALCSCGQQKIELTEDNYQDYLTITVDVLDTKVEKKTGTILGFYYRNFEGASMVRLRVVNQSGAKFENVEIACELTPFNPNVGCKWKFMPNKSLTQGIALTLPFDGNYESQIYELELFPDTQWSDWTAVADPSELYWCTINILSISGTVIIEQ